MSRRMQAVRNEFARVFGGQCALVLAPGRVNLIGEHTDYNEGFVFPVAIDREVRYAVAPRDDRHVVLRSLNFDAQAEFSLDDIQHDSEQRWSNYVRGIAWVLQDAGYPLRGMNAVIEGDVPLGAGLSSSAAMEVAALLAFEAVGGFRVDPVQAALLAQKSENQFVGLNCGRSLDENLAVLKAMRAATDKPLWMKPNAGLPRMTDEDVAVYDVTPQQMGEQVALWIEAGARVVGGCCGTSPDHLREIARAASAARAPA